MRIATCSMTDAMIFDHELHILDFLLDGLEKQQSHAI